MAAAVDRVLLLAGHRVDAPDRARPRFPAAEVPRVHAQAQALLERLGAGPRDLAITQGANGADLLFAQACVERGVPLRLLLPLPEARFIDSSVRGSGEDAAWLARWQAVRARAGTPEELADPGEAPWARANRWLLEAAQAAAGPPGALHLLCVWDGRAGDGPGGTDDLVALVRAAGGTVHRLLPSPPAAPAGTKP